MQYLIRPMASHEYDLLNDFLYEAIFVPNGMEPPPRSVIFSPELQVYVKNFGQQKDDLCLAAEVNGKIIGAVWVRDMNDYGHVRQGVPSLAISLYPQYRSHGIGTALMEQMLCLLKKQGYAEISLSVQKANRAVELYRKTGFEIIEEHDEDYIMICDLAPAL